MLSQTKSMLVRLERLCGTCDNLKNYFVQVNGLVEACKSCLVLPVWWLHNTPTSRKHPYRLCRKDIHKPSYLESLFENRHHYLSVMVGVRVSEGQGEDQDEWQSEGQSEVEVRVSEGQSESWGQGYLGNRHYYLFYLHNFLYFNTKTLYLHNYILHLHNLTYLRNYTIILTQLTYYIYRTTYYRRQKCKST